MHASSAVQEPVKNTQNTPHSRVQHMITPKGIEAWLVEDYTVPLLAMEICFKSGSTLDPMEKAGTVSLLSQLLDEGAGDYDANAFQEALEDDAIELSFSTGHHWFQASLRTLIEAKDKAFHLLHLALTKPRLDDEPIQRMKDQVIASIKQDLTDPDSVARQTFMKNAFANHAYGQKSTIESVTRITRDDLKTVKNHIITQDQMIITVVGAIDAKTLAQALDDMLGELPASTQAEKVAPTLMQKRGEIIISDLDVPNSTFLFGMPAFSHTDPDYHAAMIVNHIFGEGSFTSRLWHEVREKRGLSYSVRTSLSKIQGCPIVMGYLSTSNERAKEAYDVLIDEFRKMSETGPTQQELDAAKAYLIGSYGLRFDSSSKIANELSGIIYDGRPIDYLQQREAFLQEVTLEQAQRVAKRLYGDGTFLLSVAGRPSNL